MIFTLHRGRLCFLYVRVLIERLFPNKSAFRRATHCDVLPLLLYDLLDHKIQHATYLSPRELLDRLSRFTSSARAQSLVSAYP
jgi:hypothetical protein